MLEDKNLREICGRKRQKSLTLDRSKRESEKKFEKTFEYVKNT